MQRHSLFANELMTSLVMHSFELESHASLDGINNDALISFEEAKWFHHKLQQLLKQRCTKMQSSYPVTLKQRTRGVLNVFAHFIKAENVLSYMHCAFINHLRLEAVVSALPADAQMENGISFPGNRGTFEGGASPRSPRRRRREDRARALAAGVSFLTLSQS